MALYKKLGSAGIENRDCTLAIKLTPAECEAAKALAAENDLSQSAYFGLMIVEHLEREGRLPKGYHDRLVQATEKR